MALDKLGIKELNAMQQAAIGHCRKSDSMVLLSPTGTGKTLAYLLPLLQRQRRTSRKYTIWGCRTLQYVWQRPRIHFLTMHHS